MERNLARKQYAHPDTAKANRTKQDIALLEEQEFEIEQWLQTNSFTNPHYSDIVSQLNAIQYRIEQKLKQV